MPPSEKKGNVINREHAIQIAEKAWIKEFPLELIEKEKPFQVMLENNIWHVRGTNNEKGIVVGGCLHARISRNTGRVLEIWHDK